MLAFWPYTDVTPSRDIRAVIGLLHARCGSPGTCVTHWVSGEGWGCLFVVIGTERQQTCILATITTENYIQHPKKRNEVMGRVQNALVYVGWRGHGRGRYAVAHDFGAWAQPRACTQLTVAG